VNLFPFPEARHGLRSKRPRHSHLPLQVPPCSHHRAVALSLTRGGKFARECIVNHCSPFVGPFVHRHDACASPTSTDTTHRTPTATDTTHCTGAADSERVDRPTQLCPCCCVAKVPARRKRAGQTEAVPLATQAATVTAATPNDSSSTASIQRSVAAWADERRRRPIGVGLLQVHAISAPRHRRSAAAHATARG
jgi:hypothetical protein